MPTKTWRDFTGGSDTFNGMSRSAYEAGTHTTPLYLDDDYLSAIEQYKDKDFYQYLLNNPYLAGNQAEFTPNFLQMLSESLGDFSARRSYYGNLQSLRSEWLSNSLEQFRQQEYNEPINQVNRERLAGINPDLAPGMISPGAAAQNDQPLGSAPAMQAPGSSSIGDIANLGQSFLGSVFSVVSSLQSLRSVGLENKLRTLQVSSGFTDVAKDMLETGVTEFWNGLDNAADITNVFESGEFIDSLTKQFSNRLRSLPVSSRDKKRIRGILDDLIYSKNDDGVRSYSTYFQSLVNDSISKLKSSRNNLVKSSGLVGSDTSDTKALSFIGSKIYRPIIDAELELQRIQLKYNTEYLSTPGLGANRGAAENAAYQMQKEMLDVKKRLTNAFSAINKKILGSSDLSPIWKLALQAGVASAEAFSISKLGFSK